MLGISEIGLKILFLLIPGIIALGTIKSIGPKKQRSDLENFLQIFMYGIISYAGAGAVEGSYIWLTGEVPGAFWKIVSEHIQELSTLNPKTPLDTSQISIAAIAAVIVATLVSLSQTYGYLHKFLFKMHLTRRQSEPDIWSYTLNSRITNNWVTVRHSDGKIYQGWISGYSEGGDERELLLTSVTVYVITEEDRAVQVDALPLIYLGLDRKNVVLEFQDLEPESGDPKNAID